MAEALWGIFEGYIEICAFIAAIVGLHKSTIFIISFVFWGFLAASIKSATK